MFPRRQFGADACLRKNQACIRNAVKQQEVHEYEAVGNDGGHLTRRITSLTQGCKRNLCTYLDTTDTSIKLQKPAVLHQVSTGFCRLKRKVSMCEE